MNYRQWSANRDPDIHGVRHQAAPLVWQDGFPLGNGFLGAMLWGDGHPLNLTLDCADLWDSRTDDTFWQNPAFTYARLRELIEAKRYDEAAAIFGTAPKANELTPTKISIGRMSLAIGPATTYDCRLDLDRAVVSGKIGTTQGDVPLTAFVHRERNVICLRLPSGTQACSDLRFAPLGEVCKAMAGLGHPPPVTRSDGDKRLFVQQIPEGPAYALVWNITGPDYYLAIECAADAAAAEAKAQATWEWAMKRGFDSLQKSHESAWKKFWNVSAVFLPERRMEFFWYYGLYLLASSARRGAMPPGLQGVWAMDGVLPPWAGNYTCDMNVQETFWPACATGHLDLLDSWCDHMLACQKPARTYTQQVFNTEGTFWVGTIGLFKLSRQSNWYSNLFGWSHSGWLGWLVWLRWRYSKDAAWLRETGYPVLSDIFRFYRANLVEEADGRLHVPLSYSPEYHGHSAQESFCKDPNIDLALIRRCCDWIIEMETALGSSDLSPDAARIKEHLAPYALTAKQELCLWPGKPIDESHRHPSQLMAVHPAMDLTIEGDEQARKIIEASVNQFLSLGQSLWAGHTYAQLISMAAVLGCAGWAYDSLRQFAEHWVMPNGLHVNADWRASGVSSFSPMFGRDKYRTRTNAPFTMEANNAVTAGICDMLVQGWGDPSTGSGQADSSIRQWNGTLRIFPAVPEQWRDVAFRDLVTEGAWKVSAVRHEGRTAWVKIVAAVPGTLRLRDPFGGEAADVIEGACVLQNGFYEAELKAGQSVTLQRQGYQFDAKAVIAGVRDAEPALLGLPHESA